MIDLLLIVVITWLFWLVVGRPLDRWLATFVRIEREPIDGDDEGRGEIQPLSIRLGR